MNLLRRYRWLLALFVFSPSAFAAGPSGLVLGVHPYLPAKEVQERFAPLAAYLSEVLKQPVEVRVGRNYDEHIDAIGKDRIDIAFMGPSSYVRLVKTYKQKPLLARLETKGQPELRGVIVVRSDSKIKSLAELKGKRFAYGDRQSTMSHIVPNRMLIQAGVPDSACAHHQFLGAHKNVALAVLAGDFDAGAVKVEIYDEYAQRGLRAIATSPPVSEHLFVTRRDLPEKQVGQLRQAMLNIKSTPNGAKILAAIHKDTTNLVSVKDDHYDGLRRLFLDVAR